MKNRRYRIEETVQERFIRMPYALFANPQYKPLTPKAKILYALLLDRMTLSIKHGWKNENGEVYLIYPRETIADLLGMQPKTVSSAFKELHDAKLIEEERPGCGRSNRIYVLHAEMAADDAEKFSVDMDSNNESDSDKELEKYEQYMQMCKNDTHCTPATPENEVFTPSSAPEPLSLLPIQKGNNDASRKVKMTLEKSQNDLRETSKLPTIHTDLNQTDFIQTEGRDVRTPLPSMQNTVNSALQLFAEKCPSLPQPITIGWTPNHTERVYHQLEFLSQQHCSLDTLFTQVERSDFLTGRVAGYDKRVFRADIDWITRPDNASKILTGKYDTSPTVRPQDKPNHDIEAYERDCENLILEATEDLYAN